MHVPRAGRRGWGDPVLRYLRPLSSRVAGESRNAELSLRRGGAGLGGRTAFLHLKGTVVTRAPAWRSRGALPGGAFSGREPSGGILGGAFPGAYLGVLSGEVGAQGRRTALHTERGRLGCSSERGQSSGGGAPGPEVLRTHLGG